MAEAQTKGSQTLRPAVRCPVPRPAGRAVRLVQVIEPAERQGHGERRAAERWLTGNPATGEGQS